ncbi:glycoside hydrolase family protein [Paenibacillus sp. YYML68]|uniref:glycoside hydrolase family protein n=1 Tax=Paenibacillus sp. YYML68 TaxID=2909250 RepID=UPI0024929646|nr:glycoside hydrolase family protein [Paenibacillus sp. YYML68]
MDHYEPSSFCNRLQSVGRILELEGWHVWCCSPIETPDGKIHVFFSRWPLATEHDGWLTHSEIAHAVAEHPEGPYEVTGTVLKGRGGRHWDAATIHNPTVHQVGGRYAMLYIGNRDGTAATQRIGLAMADTIEGPWERVGDEPILDVSPVRTDWDSYLTTNPALLLHPNGQFWLYYKAWDTYNDHMRKMGLAIADHIEGPYTRVAYNPIVDFSSCGSQVEDAYVFIEDGQYHMVMRDMGVISDRTGLYLRSEDGIHWSSPMLGYHASNRYFAGPIERFERPQVLVRDGKPAYLFLALMGGRYGTSSGAILKIVEEER